MVVALAKSPLSDLYTVAFTPPPPIIVQEKWRMTRAEGSGGGGSPKKEGLAEMDEKDDADKRKKLTEGKTGCVETMGGD